MKKLIIASLALAMLFGCKKGENDPGISFRSRDARVVGEWKMASFEMEAKSVNQMYNSSSVLVTTTNTRTSKYDGSRITRTVSTTGSSQTTTVDSSTYENTLTIEKDGTCVYTEKHTSSKEVNTYTSRGIWLWADSKKNKSSITLSFTDVSTPSSFTSGTYQIDLLKNKEMVLISNDSDNDATTSKTGSSTENTNTSKYTFKQ